MNKKLNLGLVAITIIFTLSLLGCAANNTNKPSKNVTSQADDSTSNASTTDKPNATDSTDSAGKTSTETVTTSPYKYDVTSIASDTKIELNTPWESSPLGKSKATIEGKGEKAGSEGYSHIIIKDVNSNKLTKLTFENEEQNKLTARDLEWIDENNLFVILGQSFGTVSKGGSIYKVNILSGETTLYLKTTNSKEEFTAVHKSENVFKFEKYVYEDDNFIKGHSETGVLELK